MRCALSKAVPLLLLLLLASTMMVMQRVAAQLPGRWLASEIGPRGREDFGFDCPKERSGSIYPMSLWLIGGKDANGPLKNDGLWRFDLADRKWSSMEAAGFDDDQQAFELIVDEYEGYISLLAVSGKKYSTNAPTPQIQALELGSQWTRDVDALSSADYEYGTPEPASAYFFASFRSIDQFGPGETKVGIVGGVTGSGFTSTVSTLDFNASKGTYLGTSWSFAITPEGAEGVNYPVPNFGACAAKDPFNNDRIAVIFGGTNREVDTNEIWKLDYTPYTDLTTVYTRLTTTGTPPTPRRLASCAFVGPNLFAVTGGYNSGAGGPVNDAATYVLNVVTLVWTRVPSTVPNFRPFYSAKMTTCVFNNNTGATFLWGGNVGGGEYTNVLYYFDTMANGFIKLPINQAQPHQVEDPPARAFHGAALQRGHMVIVGGIGPGNVMLDDIWEYDMRKVGTGESAWSQIAQFGDKFAGRWSAQAAAAVGSIFLYGGWLTPERSIDDGGLASDLVEVDVMTGRVSVLNDYDTSKNPQNPAAVPGGRADHSSFIQNTYFVVAGGVGNLGKMTSRWNSYSLVTQKWSRMCLNGDCLATPPSSLARFMAVSTSINATHALYGLGFQFIANFDMYFVSSVSSDSFKLTELRLTPATGDRRDYIRGAAGILLFPSMALICGGTVDPAAGLLPPVRSLCYRMILEGATAGRCFFSGTSTDSRDNMLLGASTLYYLSAIIVYGGYLGNGIAASREFMNGQVLKFVLDNSALCEEGCSGSCGACVQCALGSRNTGDGTPSKPKRCVLAPRGYYSTDSLKTDIPCPAGTFGDAIGATDAQYCVPCFVNMFNELTGQMQCSPCPVGKICPVGTITPLDINSPRAQRMLAPFIQGADFKQLTEVHPSAYQSPSVPPMPTIIVGALMFIGIVSLGLVFCFGWSQKRRRHAHYITPATMAELSILYNQYSRRSKFGMCEDEMLEMFVAERTGSVLPPNRLADPEACHLLFMSIDRYRAGALTFGHFIEAIILAVSLGYCDPVPGSPSAEPGQRKLVLGSCAASLGSLALDDLDMFDDDHDLAELGESRKKIQTRIGGIATVVGLVLLICLIVASTLDFMLSAVAETKSTVPFSVIKTSFDSAVVHTPMSISVTSYPILRPDQGPKNLKEGCVSSAANAPAGQCSTANAIALGFSTTKPVNGSLPTTLTCTFSEPDQSCTVVWECADCTILARSNVTITTSPAYAAPVLNVRVRVGSAIKASTQSFLGSINPSGGDLLFSELDAYISPAKNSTLLSGFPASVVDVALTPSYFEAQEHSALWGGDAVTRTTGYHVRSTTASVTPGNSIPPQMFSRKFDIPLRVDFSEDPSPLYVKRIIVRTILDFLTGLLGAVGGFMGSIVAVMNFIEGLDAAHPNSSNVDEDDSECMLTDRVAEESDNNNNSQSKYHDTTVGENGEEMRKQPSGVAAGEGMDDDCTGPTAAEFGRLKTLMVAGLPLQQAWAVNRCIDLALNKVEASPLPDAKRRASFGAAPSSAGHDAAPMPHVTHVAVRAAENSV